MNSHRTHIVIPEKLVVEIDRLVGKRGRSQFLAAAAEKELKRRRLQAALQQAAGCWKDGNHPELTKGSVHWVQRLRRENESRGKS
jgi:hypothetical protein